MTCKRCGHHRESHERGACRVKVLTGWDEGRKYFTGRRDCKCEGYAPPPVTVSRNNCPHEFRKDEPGCVHCGMPVSATK